MLPGWLPTAVQMPEMDGEKLQIFQTGRLRKLSEGRKERTNIHQAPYEYNMSAEKKKEGLEDKTENN